MAVRYICDKCKKEITDVKYQLEITVHKDNIEKSFTTDWPSVTDLCEDCYKAFMASLREGVKK